MKVRGHLTLEEQRASGKTRLMLSAAVGLATFFLGIGLVAALADEGENEKSAETVEVKPAPLKVPVAPPTAKTDAPAVPAPAKKETPDSDTAAAAAPAEEKSATAEDSTKADAESPKEDVPPEETAKEEPPVEEATPVAETPPSGDWWENARGKKCKIDFGEHTRLIMREGELRRDDTITYGPYAENEILLRVRKVRDPVVIPHFFGFHPRTKKPGFAYVTVLQQGTEKKGVLPLKIRDDHLTLVPQ